MSTPHDSTRPDPDNPQLDERLIQLVDAALVTAETLYMLARALQDMDRRGLADTADVATQALLEAIAQAVGAVGGGTDDWVH